MDDNAYDPDPSEKPVDIDEELEGEDIYPNSDPVNNNTDPINLDQQVRNADKQTWED